MQKHQSIGMLIKRIHDTLEKEANNNLRQQGLTMSQAVALGKLNRIPGKAATLKELERIMGVAQSTTAGIILRLEQKGLVQTSAVSCDRRIKMVNITPLGEQFCRSGEEHMAAAESRLLSGLGEKEKPALQLLLEKIYDALK
ncbi:MAG: MarR family transcriptional regulator [Treponema sp.]|nr:MarR family transcriptional regulator [Treponema sp.]